MRSLLDRLGPRRDAVADWSMAIGLTLFGWAQLALIPLFMTVPGHGGGPGPGDVVRQVPLLAITIPAPTWLSYVLLAAATLPLGLRRRFPVAVLAASVLFSSVYDLAHQPPVLVTIAPLIALYTVGTLMERRALTTVAISTIAFALAAALPAQQLGRMFAEGVRVTAMFAFVAALGDATRNRRAYIAEVEQRAMEAERTRDQEARRRVEEERLRIARELHDVTAHSLSIIAVQAGAAQRVVERDPAAAVRALETIRTTSKASLDELRAILGVLRGADDGAPLAPTGSLARLDELVASVRDAGVAVELIAGEVGDVPAYAEVSAYRIIQEALTNVVRHAHASNAEVRVTREGDELLVEVVDDGAAVTQVLAASASAGHGIVGMRERVAALGGGFEVGRRPGGGFRVAARIPLGGSGS